jgi:hypothetical protein
MVMTRTDPNALIVSQKLSMTSLRPRCKPFILYYFDQMFLQVRVTEGRELNSFGTGDGDSLIFGPK